MVHSVRTNRVKTADQEKAIAELQAQNPQLKNKVKFLKLTWKTKTLKSGKPYGPLLTDVETPDEANIMVEEGLLHGKEPKECEIFGSECNMTQCYKCQGYGHIAVTCRKPQTCANCAKEYHSGGCPTLDDPSKHFCCDCKGKHHTWDRACPVRRAEAEPAAAAYKTRPMSYKTAGKSLCPAQTQFTQLSSSPLPPQFVANQGQPAPLMRTVRKRARQFTTLAAGEHAEDSSITAPEQVGEMEGITPAIPQPPSTNSAASPRGLPAFVASSFSSTSSQTRPRIASVITACPRSPSDSL
jgi:hypothetical protein